MTSTACKMLCSPLIQADEAGRTAVPGAPAPPRPWTQPWRSRPGEWAAGPPPRPLDTCVTLCTCDSVVHDRRTPPQPWPGACLRAWSCPVAERDARLAGRWRWSLTAALHTTLCHGLVPAASPGTWGAHGPRPKPRPTRCCPCTCPRPLGTHDRPLRPATSRGPRDVARLPPESPGGRSCVRHRVEANALAAVVPGARGAGVGCAAPAFLHAL